MKICSWNTENFFIFLDKYKDEDINELSNDQWEKFSLSSVKNKHIQKVIDSAKAVKDIDADLYILSEMGGRESLQNFNKYFLNDNYDCFLKNGNSNRGIEIGFLVKKNLDYSFEVHSNKDLVLDNGYKFSRNVPELRVSNKNGDLILIVLGVHLKSKISSAQDFEGIDQRTSELKLLSSYASTIKEMYSVPVIIAGDFNCSRMDYELNIFSKEMYEFHDLKKSKDEELCTYVNFKVKRILTQIDYIFCTENIFDLDNSFTYRFKDDYGYSLGIPDSFEEKKYLPSDHFPLVAKIKIK